MKDILIAAFAGTSFVVGTLLGYSNGWRDAELKNDAIRTYVLDKMQDLGFCAPVDNANSGGNS